MLNKKLCIYITGLPAAGKTTVARYIAEHLSLPLLDKDDYLEKLFDDHGCANMEQRKALSRSADQLFIADAQLLNNAVIVSHWHPAGATSDSGTPTDWLLESFDEVVEVFCDCSTACAKDRFIKRVRHQGHNDDSRTPAEIEVWFAHYASLLPINIGRCIHLNSDGHNWQQVVESKIFDILCRSVHKN